MNHSINEDGLLLFIKDVSREDERAFKQLYDYTHQKTFQYLFRLTGNRELAEDLLIETYTEIWKSAGKFQGRSKVHTWIIGIARNLAMNEFRKNNIKEFELDEEMPCLPNQFACSSACERSTILEKALDLLPRKHREVLDCVFLQEMGYEDISHIMGIPVSTVKTRVFYAKEKLRTVFGSMGIKKDDLL